jgi:hypothetical protein
MGRYRAVVGMTTCASTLAFALTGCVLGGRSTPTTVTVHDNGATRPPQVYQSSTAAVARGPATSIPGDGTFRVGVDVQPGTYQSQGSDECYWARLSGLGGSLNDIIANSNAAGPQVVQIASSDVAFKTQNCGMWNLTSGAGSAPSSAPAATFQPPAAMPAPREPAALPPNAEACPDNHSAVGTSITTCAFAEQVRLAYAASGPPSTRPRDIDAYSPVTQQYYTMTCSASGGLVTCSGGNDALVYVH